MAKLVISGFSHKIWNFCEVDAIHYFEKEKMNDQEGDDNESDMP